MNKEGVYKLQRYVLMQAAEKPLSTGVTKALEKTVEIAADMTPGWTVAPKQWVG